MKHMLLEEEVVRKLKLGSWMLVTVESCTGGLLAHRLTQMAGVSAVFAGSFVVYDNAFKVSLGVPPSLLTEKGAVSEEVAVDLAQKGLLKLESFFPAKTLWTLSTTGIAGPTGSTDQKPLGLCYTALAHEGKPTESKRILTGEGDRKRNIERFATEALQLLDAALEKALDQTAIKP